MYRFGIVLCLVLIFAFFFVDSRPISVVIQTEIRSASSSIGTADDPDARARYEWMRTRNPRTNEIPPNIRARELAYASTLPTKENYIEVLRKSGSSENVQILDWVPRGPFNVGGRTRALAIDVTNENIILAGGVSGGMWRSTNGGETWTKTTSPDQLHSVSSIVQDTHPGKTNIWYVGTGELRGNSARGRGAPYRGDGVFKST
ncbi:hypothetical protein IIB79_05865, partial [candidate division KSB1 bacterium]|nr:hypothetical protein [candidate division KSB1 bacterium]